MGFFDTPGVDSFDDNGVLAVRINDTLGGYSTGETAEQRLQRLRQLSGPVAPTQPAPETPEADNTVGGSRYNGPPNVRREGGELPYLGPDNPRRSSSGTSDVDTHQVGNIQGPALTAMNYFISQGWPAHQAAGIVGSLQQESFHDLRTGISGDAGQAYGIAQWHGDRQRNFESVYGKPIQGSSLEEQLAFVQWELENTEKAAAANLRNATTASEAATVMGRDYERAGVLASRQRARNAERLIVPVAPKQTSALETQDQSPVEEHGLLQLASMTGPGISWKEYMKDVGKPRKSPLEGLTEQEILDLSTIQRQGRDKVFQDTGFFQKL